VHDEGATTDLYEPISSAVYTAPKANLPERSSATRVCANEARSTFERTASLRPSAERRASAAGVSGKIGHWASEAANATAAGECCVWPLEITSGDELA
jgi:hypothetical protein